MKVMSRAKNVGSNKMKYTSTENVAFTLFCVQVIAKH